VGDRGGVALMARPRKVPAVLVEATIRENGKLAALPSDTARLGYFYICLGAAKLLNPPGMFSSRQHFKEVSGRFSRYIDAYLLNGLVELAPKLCERCRERWSTMAPKKGQIVVHDWHEHQYDPARLDRQRAYDDRQRRLSEAVDGSQSDPVSDAQSVGVSDPVSDAVSAGFLAGDSRGGARDRVPGARRTLNVEPENEEEGPPDLVYPANGKATQSVKGFSRVGDVVETLAEQSDDWTQALTITERDEWSSFGPEWDAFRSAWLAQGFRHPPRGEPDDDPDAPNPSQRALLWSILDAWPNEAPRWIAEAPKRLTASQVVARLLDRWHGKRDEGTERAAMQEVEAIASKASERKPATDPRVSAFVAEVSK
jgi:hypothetical protein